MLPPPLLPPLTPSQTLRYSHVNKKALDQYVNFSTQREALLNRKSELDEASSSIENLIVALDQQKEAAILRTFKGASHHFSQVFKELVPAGSGNLVMRTADDQDAQVGDLEGVDDAEDQRSGGASAAAAARKAAVSTFTGVEVRVSFSGGGEVFLMQQLSGGQKALVALAIIFSIQRCDPAPFYLFDEIDQALDSTYRAAVAALIRRQARSRDNPAQFITTTFRPELVRVADKCYGIALQNKNSNCYCLEQTEALAFVADLMNEEESVDRKETAPMPSSASRAAAASSRKRRAIQEVDEVDEDEGEDGGGGESGGDDDDDDEDVEDDAAASGGEEELPSPPPRSGGKRKARS